VAAAAVADTFSGHKLLPALSIIYVVIGVSVSAKIHVSNRAKSNVKSSNWQ
jgi:hypothetical protein